MSKLKQKDELENKENHDRENISSFTTESLVFQLSNKNMMYLDEILVQMSGNSKNINDQYNE